jgi:DMSO/TMAO reductase YedYZ molybdopterin-dependent catalytic subunit
VNKEKRFPAIKICDIEPELRKLNRRAFLGGTLSLGSLALLTGCDLSTHSGVDAALEAILRFDDRVQAALFSGARMAQTYPASAISKPFRFNAYYPEWEVRTVPDGWRLAVTGRVSEKTSWTIQQLRALPQVEQIYAAYLCRRVESDRAVEWRTALRISASSWRGLAGPLREVCLLRRVLDQH